MPFCQFCIPDDEIEIGKKITEELLKTVPEDVEISVASDFEEASKNLIQYYSNFIKDLWGADSYVYHTHVDHLPGIC